MADIGNELVPTPARKEIPPLTDTPEGKYYGIFYEMRYNFRDDLPTAQVSQSDPDYYRYKCTGNVIYGMGMQLSQAAGEVVHDPRITEEIEALCSYPFKYYEGKFTTPDEITRMNKTLDSVLAYLAPKALLPKT